MNTEKVKQTTDQITAAYALNLWTVSISQIIDYNDVNVLKQEYETIMNNLNLDNMPKDEALLDVIKEIMEEITFLRISEGDKGIVERESAQAKERCVERCPQRRSHLCNGKSGRNGRHSCNAGRYRIHELSPQSSRL